MLSNFVIILSLMSFGSVVQGKKQTGHSLGDIAEVIGDLITAVDGCKYTCPNGGRPYAVPSHKPSADGCGSYGMHFELTPVPGADECCNTHDICYDTCNSDKSKCDLQLQHCLNHLCLEMEDPTYGVSKEHVKDCRTVVKYVYGVVAAAGCDAYKSAQDGACICPSRNTSWRK